MKNVKRHAVDIKSKTTTLGPRGQLQGSDTTVASSVPCSIEPLQGRELELARQIVADASFRVTMYGDPDWSLTTKHWLEFGSRRLNIGYIRTPDEIDLEYELLCGEAV